MFTQSYVIREAVSMKHLLVLFTAVPKPILSLSIYTHVHVFIHMEAHVFIQFIVQIFFLNKDGNELVELIKLNY